MNCTDSRQSVIRNGRNAQSLHGFTLVELLVVISIIGVLIAILLPAIQASRATADRTACLNNMRQIGLAMQQHESIRGWLPSGAVSKEYSPEPTLVWTFYRWSALAQLTPYMDQSAVYDRLDMTVPFYVGSPPTFSIRPKNADVVKLLLPEFLCPSDIGQRVHADLGPTNYVVSAGSGVKGGSPLAADADGAFFTNSQTRFAHIVDGLSRTILISESLLGQPRASGHDPQTEYKFSFLAPLTDSLCANASQWNVTDPRGFSWASGEYRCALYNHYLTPNSPTPDCMGALVGGGISLRFTAFGWRAARSNHKAGVNVVLADASGHFVADTIDPEIWKSLSTIKGREIDDLP
jgi:prepilin-type N-terminal cleavage/methylation domain-containing protein